MNIGSIVLYKNRPSVIVSKIGEKFEIETETGIKKVREKDFTVLSASNTQNLNTVLNAVCNKPDFDGVTDFFEEGLASFEELTELFWSDLKPEQIWAAWQIITSSPLFSAESPDKPIRIRSKEEIEKEFQKQTEKENEEKERTDFINALSACIKNNSPQNFDIKKYAPFLQEIEALALDKTDKSKILRDIHIKETPEAAHKILLTTEYWKNEKNPYPIRLKHPVNSSKTELPPLNRNHKYLDLTGLTAYAIDNEDSTDPDDAVCFDGKYLWIHIANPADTITPDSESDKDARKRGATLYLPEGISRMLGETAVENFALGLTPESYALSFKLKLDNNAEIIESEILRTKINVKCMTYEEADGKKEEADLKPLFEIAEQNRKKRENNGAVSIDMPEVTITAKETDGIQKVFIEQYIHTESSLMIKEMMLLAGEASARFAFKNNIPFQYISQEAPEIPKKLPDGLAGEYRKRKAMHPRTVGTIPSMHAALGIAMYSQVTSPLRRYGDLAAHQQLLKFIDKEPLMKTDDLLMRISAGDISGRNCSSIERVSRQHWTLVYLLQNPDWQGEAVILDSIKLKAHICIPSIAFETDMFLKKELSINEKITVRAENIDLPNLTVRFMQI